MSMKMFLNTLWRILEEIRRVRAAAALARLGKVSAAQQLIK